MRFLMPLLLAATLLAGCGSYSQARYDDLGAFKRNHGQDVERALADELTAIELRSSLESIDKAMLAELALQGGEADLEKARQQLEAESDQAVADLFNGDTGR